MKKKKVFQVSFDFLSKATALLVAKGWLAILISAVALTAVSVVSAKKLELDSDIMSLLPSRDPVVSDFLKISKAFGFSDKLIALIEVNTASAKGPAAEFMDRFAEQLERSPLIKSVDYKLPGISFNENAKRIEDKIDVYYTFYDSGGKDAFLMFISPLGTAGDVEFTKELMKEAEKAQRLAGSGMSGSNGGFSIEYGGSYIIAFEESTNMERNIKISILTSLACILLLFFLIFRRVDIVLCVGIPLIMAISWTLMVAYLTVTSLNIMTIAFAAILAGLGIDFGIHICNRFLLETDSGRSPREAVERAIFTTGKSVFFSCVTTSLAFFSLLFTRFSGAREFGFLIGIGVILCMAAMLFVLPSLLIMGAAIRGKRQGPIMRPDGFRVLALFVERRGRGMAILLISLFIACGLFLFSKGRLPEFDNGMTNIGSIENRGIAVQKKILRLFGNYVEPIAIVASSRNSDQAVTSLRKIMPDVRRLVGEGVLRRAESIFKYIPQQEKQDLLLEKMQGIKDPERAIEQLLERFKDSGSKKEEYDFFLREKDRIAYFLKNGFSVGRSSYAELKKMLPAALFGKFFAEDEDGGEYHTICYAYPAERIVRSDQAAELADALHIDGTKLRMTGFGLLVGKLGRIIQREFRFITLLIGAVLILVLLVLYRRISLVVISVVPVFMSLAATVMVMLAMGIKLNYMNIVAFPLIIGMGIDDSIHMVHRYLEDNKKDIGAMISQTGRAILLTSLTTMCGFGSLLFTKHNGLISLGITTAAGIGFCLLFSMFVLPGLIMFTEDKR